MSLNITISSPQSKDLLLSNVATEIITVANLVVMCSVISVFGITTNIVTIVVYVKQGFTNTINISILGLAISDMCGLISLLWFSVCLNPAFINSGFPIIHREILHLASVGPRGCFVDVTRIIMAYITSERCLCVVVPHRVKQIITPRRTAVVICVIYQAVIMTLIPEYMTHYLGWVFYPHTNRTLISLIKMKTGSCIDGLTPLLFAIFGITSFVFIVISTYILIWKLNQTSQWRNQSTTKSGQRSHARARRDDRVIRMVLLLAVAMILFQSPSIILTIMEFAESTFNVTGLHSNVYWASWSVVTTLEATNSSIGIFFYYRMSSNFRATFHQILGSQCNMSFLLK